MEEPRSGQDATPGSSTGALGRLDARAMLSIVRVSTLIENQLEAELRESGSGLRANEWDALVFLAEEGPMRPSELLRHTTLCLSPGTMHAILARLEDRGLVERSSHPDHERGVIYAITSEGESVITQIMPVVDRHILHRFAGQFSDEELATIIELTARM